MTGINAERDIWKHLMEVMDRLEEVEAQGRNEREKHRAEMRREREEHRAEVSRMLTQHREEKRRAAARIEELEGRIEELQEVNLKLQDEISRLKHKDDKDSHNSSLPPSTDQRPTKAPNEHNGRQKSGRKSGGQKGHPGRTLRLKKSMERLSELGIAPVFEGIGDKSDHYKDRLLLDIAMTAQATLKRYYMGRDGKYHIPAEHHSEVVYGSGVKALVVLLHGQGVQSAERIVELVAAISGQAIQLSQGTIYEWLEEFHRQVVRTEQPVIESHLLDHDVVLTDGTAATVNGQQTPIRNFSVSKWVLYVPMRRKDLSSLREIPFLKKFTGILTHDHETALYHFGTNHAECNVHLIRYLTANSENTGHSWSSRMISLLTEMNRYRKRLMAQGQRKIPDATIRRLEGRYDELLSLARQEHKGKPCRYRWAMKEENALLNRLKKYKRNHLLFLHDFDVPFDNNMSERDLRKCKNRQKMAGGFRTHRGKEIFCSVLSITETCKRQARNLINAFRSIFLHKSLFASAR